jgi:hypothetical protein
MKETNVYDDTFGSVALLEQFSELTWARLTCYKIWNMNIGTLTTKMTKF